LPNRCLVLDQFAEENDTFHLEETAGKTGQYITLSHRWSEFTDQCKTTIENYNDRIAGQALHLPLLFKDALLIASRLGVKYVWIDSICIIQNCGADWAKESLKMKDYYTNSYVTIAAGIPEPEKGLALSAMASNQVQRLSRLPYRNDKGERQGYFYLYQQSPTLKVAYRKEVTESHLLRRGWVFQEWCLSRRIIYFAAETAGHRIFYHCQT
jgi:hypothetical protein